ncbi:MAG: molybdenum cofactor cytidylyltransferase [Verrucomicrobiota bacterium]|jgi:molybdenum cofactor cytidylyltransferase
MRNVGAIILAAGGSSRFGQAKQLLSFHGESLVRRAVRGAIEADCACVAVVTGEARDRIENELRETSAVIIENPEWQRGLGSSIRCGLRHLVSSSLELDAIVLLACDQPFVDASIIKSLIAQWENSRKPIVASSYAGTLGVPALFDRSCFEALLALPDGSGAKSLIESRAADVARIEFEKGAIDIDTPGDFQSCF